MIFRRKAKNDDVDTTATDAEPGAADDLSGGGPDDGAGTAQTVAEGPYDSSEIDPEALEAEDRINLGALVITGIPGMELRLQVDEQSGEVQAILLVIEESALELRAFAAPKSAGIWDEVRREVAAEASRIGGTATEVDGPFDTELRLVLPVEDPEGQIVSQTSRVIGVNGPRWLLRATVLGRAAVDPEAALPMEETLRNVVVVRGAEPMIAREPLPLRLPPGAQPIEDESAE